MPIKTKICSKCHQDKMLGMFYKHLTNKDGMQTWCKTCEGIERKTETLNANSINNEGTRRQHIWMNSKTFGRESAGGNKNWKQC